jgi:5-enolpyruvylshikimate-3-phosphate synthase
VLDGSTQLRKRPMKRVTEPLRAMGATIRDTGGLPPIRIDAAIGPLRGIDYAMPIASAQVKSAILFAGLYADGPTTIREPAPTRDHTERLLRAAGIKIQTLPPAITLYPPERPLNPLDLKVPADFSSAAFFLVAATIVPHGRVNLAEVNLNPTRIGLFDVLRNMGANIVVGHEFIHSEFSTCDL